MAIYIQLNVAAHEYFGLMQALDVVLRMVLNQSNNQSLALIKNRETGEIKKEVGFYITKDDFKEIVEGLTLSVDAVASLPKTGDAYARRLDKLLHGMSYMVAEEVDKSLEEERATELGFILRTMSKLLSEKKSLWDESFDIYEEKADVLEKAIYEEKANALQGKHRH